MTTTSTILRQWLALEHQAVWLYPVIGARFSDEDERATVSFETHRTTRDGLLRRMRELDVEPVPVRLTYGDGPPSTKAAGRAAARDLESRITAACLALSGAADGDTRAYALRNLLRAAVAETTWGAGPRAFPGLP